MFESQGKENERGLTDSLTRSEVLGTSLPFRESVESACRLSFYQIAIHRRSLSCSIDDDRRYSKTMIDDVLQFNENQAT